MTTNLDTLQTFGPPSLHRLETDIRTGHTSLKEVQEGALAMLDVINCFTNPQTVIQFVEQVFDLIIN